MRVALFLLVVSVCACGRGGSRLAYGSGRDVENILAANGVKAPPVTCKNPRLGGSIVRGVSCTLRLTSQDVDTLVARVPLAPSNLPLFHGHTDSCEATPGLGSKDRGVEMLAGKNTKVTNGASDVSVHVVRATGAACIEIRYPWG